MSYLKISPFPDQSKASRKNRRNSQLQNVQGITVNCMSYPKTSMSKVNSKNPVSIIDLRFPNDPCGASNGRNGTCFTASECSAKEY